MKLFKHAERWKQISFVSIHSLISFDYALISFTAAFGFGEDIGALAAWEQGEELNMVKANDQKSKKIALV